MSAEHNDSPSLVMVSLSMAKRLWFPGSSVALIISLELLIVLKSGETLTYLYQQFDLFAIMLLCLF